MGAEEPSMRFYVLCSRKFMGTWICTWSVGLCASQAGCHGTNELATAASAVRLWGMGCLAGMVDWLVAATELTRGWWEARREGVRQDK